MSNVFTRDREYTEKVKRNTFDGSFQNNLTLNMGGLYPVFCKEVIPGDSFKITPTFGLQFMPMVFPVQTRIRAYLHFFYCRNRPAWKDWPDFIGKTKDDIVPPYISLTRDNFDKMVGERSLGDYLGVPNTTVGGYGNSTPLDSGTMSVRFMSAADFATYLAPFIKNHSHTFEVQDIGVPSPTVLDVQRYYLNNSAFLSDLDELLSNSVFDAPQTYWPTEVPLYEDTIRDVVPPAPAAGKQVSAVFPYLIYCGVGLLPESSDFDGGGKIVFTFPSSNETDEFSYKDSSFVLRFTNSSGDYLGYSVGKTDDGIHQEYEVPAGANRSFQIFTFGQAFYTLNSDISHFERYALGVAPFDPLKGFVDFEVAANKADLVFSRANASNPPAALPNFTGGLFASYGQFVSGTSESSTVITFDNCPYVRKGDSLTGRIPLNALPFRHYESIYNAFYRNDSNNPYILDGVAEYNKWIPTTEGGPDENLYQLRYRNWEADFLTTAKQSPQQGPAPLVGISESGKMTFEDESGKRYYAQATFSEDGETLQGFKVQSPDMPAGNMRQLVDMATSGISINDFRNVNALQRWLEKNLRRGLKYRDQIKSHYDVDISYQELDMPEFIGGLSEDVNISTIRQTTPTAETPLGWFSGVGGCAKSSNHSISHYCDEHGYIIGILSVCPVPNYSQLLPKFFLKRQALDYYFPEFGHIGLQPILYNEVCPIQAFSDDPSKLLDTFGYQRAWYDYLANVDEVHGLFRTNLRNFLINRVFDVQPELSPEFLEVRPDSVNNVFSVTDTESSDKILGQVWFDVKMKRPIPIFGIPRLEA